MFPFQGCARTDVAFHPRRGLHQTPEPAAGSKQQHPPRQSRAAVCHDGATGLSAAKMRWLAMDSCTSHQQQIPHPKQLPGQAAATRQSTTPEQPARSSQPVAADARQESSIIAKGDRIAASLLEGIG
jgi:hypothetical protein